jgi:transposase
MRKAMFGKMVITENMSRGVIHPFGLKVGQVSTDRFEARVGELVANLAELAQIVEPLLAARAAMRLPFVRMHQVALAAARKDEPVWREDVLQHSGAFHSALVSA